MSLACTMLFQRSWSHIISSVNIGTLTSRHFRHRRHLRQRVGVTTSRMTSAGVSSTNSSSPAKVHPIAVAGFQEGTEYDSQRPGYTDEAVDFINDILHSVQGNKDNIEDSYDVVEVGSGTGKFTFSFLRRIDKPIKYLATEPLSGMLNVLKQKSEEVETLLCTADKLPLPPSSVKMVVAADSFHWFDNLESLREIHRVLVPGGKVVLLWHQRDRSVQWIDELTSTLCEMHATLGSDRCQVTKKWKKVFEQFDDFGPLQYVCKPHPPMKGSVQDILTYLSTISVLKVPENMSRVSDFIKNHPDLQGQTEIALLFNTDIYWCEKLI